MRSRGNRSTLAKPSHLPRYESRSHRCISLLACRERSDTLGSPQVCTSALGCDKSDRSDKSPCSLPLWALLSLLSQLSIVERHGCTAWACPP